jgi:imidazolonepropionase-like amidohydrolase
MIRFLAFLFATTAVVAQVSTTSIDGLREKRVPYVAYVNCTAIPYPGARIDSAVIIVRDERIVRVGKNLEVPQGADVRDLRGAYVYAGFVEPYLDVQALRGSQSNTKPAQWDEDEQPNTPEPQGAHYWNQAVRPERRATDALRINEDVARDWQALGYGAASTVSVDGIFSGSAATVLMRGGTSSKTVIADNVYQRLSYSKGSSKTPYPSSQMGSIALIRQAFLDAAWYGKAHAAAQRVITNRPPEVNLSLEALQNAVTSKTPFLTESYDEHDIVRWHRIAQEAGVPVVHLGTGMEFRRLSSIAATKPEAVIIPLTFPDVPDMRDAISAHEVGLTLLINWYWAPDNARLLDSAGIRIAFTLNGLKDKSALLTRVRDCIKRGLREDAALAALTTEPATIARAGDRVGRIDAGYYANLVITNGPLFDEKTEIDRVIVAGSERVLRQPVDLDVRGHWTLTSSGLPAGKSLRVKISGTADQPSAEFTRDSITLQGTFSLQGKRAAFTISLDTLGTPGLLRAASAADSIMFSGEALMPDGRAISFIMRRDSTLRNRDERSSWQRISQMLPMPRVYPMGPFGVVSQPVQADVVLKNATVWTCGPQGVIENADVVLRQGKIVAVGKGLTAASSIDCSGMHITPGIIDEHSHIAISRGVNEGTHAVTTEVRIGDVLDPDDVNIYRQLAGGVTSTHLLHGSANPMGGQLQYIKTRWGTDAEGLKVEGAVPTVKFALGENVKQANWGDRYTSRYPQTRMGVEQIMRDAFRTAREYERDLKANDPNKPVRQDLQLDALVEILNSKRNIHCHSYVQSEILMLMRLAEEFGFRVHTFTHILEGYKVAQEMAKHGSGASSFADWWAYKMEVFDAIPESPAIMHDAGVNVSINSDDAEMARRLNQEAAKSVKYGNVAEIDAMKFVTINAAKQMAIDQRTGSLEAGKDGDVVVWTGHPLSNMSRVERTFVDGREYFSRAADVQLRERDTALRRLLEQEAIKAIGKGAPAARGGRGPRREYHCDTIEDEVAGR